MAWQPGYTWTRCSQPLSFPLSPAPALWLSVRPPALCPGLRAGPPARGSALCTAPPERGPAAGHGCSPCSRWPEGAAEDRYSWWHWGPHPVLQRRVSHRNNSPSWPSPAWVPQRPPGLLRSWTLGLFLVWGKGTALGTSPKTQPSFTQCCPLWLRRFPAEAQDPGMKSRGCDVQRAQVRPFTRWETLG